MTPERWRQVTDIFHVALARDAAARETYLAEACQGDAALRVEVDALLAGHKEAGSFGAWPWVVRHEVPSLPAGTRLGPYELEGLLGTGGMGEVYRAHDTRLGRAVAVKVLPELFRDDPERRRRFEREARAISNVTHPHICTLYDVGEHDGLTFLVMELVEGETLATRLAGGPLPVDVALRHGIEIAGALDRAHHHGIVHRDLKPGNVMLTKDGAKLLDFGLAKLRAEPAGIGPGAPTRGAPSTADGAILGTLPYMAPEQLEGKEADARTDIFAFGAMLYEMLCGRRAFDGDSRASVISAILRDEPPPIGVQQPLVPASLDRVVRTCLPKQPDQRWQSAADLARELQRVLGERPALAAATPSRVTQGALDAVQDSSAVQRTSAPNTRPAHRKTWIAAALVLALAGAWAIVGRFSNRGGAPADAGPPLGSAQRIAVLPFSYKGNNTYAYYGESMVDLLSGTLDGAGPLQTVDPRAVLGLLRQQRGGRADASGGSPVQGATLDVARDVANALDVRRFVLGEIVEAGGRLRIAARMYRTDGIGESVAGDVEGGPDELFRLVDDLTRQLATGVGADPNAQLRKTAARTTTSLKALKAFLRGEQLFRGGTMQAKAALAAYRQAVDLDSSFAIAWYRLSQLAYFSGTPGLLTEYAEIAARHSRDLPWRERRLLEAYWAQARGALLESEDAYREILQKYPDDIEALFGAVMVLGVDRGWIQARPLSLARQMLQAFLRYEPEDTMGLWYLGHSEASAGNCEAAHSAYRRSFSGREIGPAFQAVVVFCRPPSKEQEELLQAARGKPLQLFKANWVSGISRNPRAAAALVRLAEPNDDARMRAVTHLFLAEMELTLGRTKAAREQFAHLATVNPDWALADRTYRRLASHQQIDTPELRRLLASVQGWDTGAIPSTVADPTATPIALRQLRHVGVQQHLRTYLLGRIYAQLHDFQSALRYAGELDRMGSPKDAGSLNRDLAHSVRAHVLAQQGKFEEALHALEAAPREVPFSKGPHSWAYGQPQERFLRAELLSRLRRHEEALGWYQSISYWPESVLAGPSHLRQGEILERLGQREQAIEQYRRFVDLWRDCDPEFRPMVKNAELALRRLGSS